MGEAVSAWVLAGVEDRKLLRLSQMRELEGTEGGGLCKQLTLSKLRMPGEMEERDRRRKIGRASGRTECRSRWSAAH